MDRENVMLLDVDELKKLCTEYELDAEGKKLDLQVRILEHLNLQEHKEDCKSSDVLSSMMAECKICSDPLATDPVVILAKDAKRTCTHFFHQACIKHIREVGLSKCPFCRKEFHEVIVIPNMLQNPVDWFKFADFDKCGTLSYQHILEIFRASMHLDHRRLEAELPKVFSRWDTDGDGRLSYEEMMAERTGLVAWAQQFLPKPQDFSKIPDITRHMRAWFLFWDEDGNGRLDKEEVLRALLKTFHRDSSISTMHDFRGIIQGLWKDMDPDGSGEIDHVEFCMRDGLYESILANLSVPGDTSYAEEMIDDFETM